MLEPMCGSEARLEGFISIADMDVGLSGVNTGESVTVLSRASLLARQSGESR